MKFTHPGRTLRQPTGVFDFCAALAAAKVGRRRLITRCALLIVMTAITLGCQPGPESFPQRFDAAAAQGLEELLPLLTRHSRAAVQALSHSKGEGANPFLPVKGAHSTKLLGVRAIDRGVVVQVSAADPAHPGKSRNSEWVLRQEDGAWRLDVLATANRRPLP